MKRRTALDSRLPMVLGAVALLILVGMAPLYATSATGSQNPDVSVSVSLTPDTALIGTRVTETYSLTNNTTALLVATVTRRLTYPSGQTWMESVFVALFPGETRVQTQTYTITAAHPEGTYEAFLSATGMNGTSMATATVTVD
jgi:uncharacterized protein (DUF58 family)